MACDRSVVHVDDFAVLLQCLTAGAGHSLDFHLKYIGDPHKHNGFVCVCWCEHRLCRVLCVCVLV